MMNKNNLLCIYLVTAFLLYDLYFDITSASSDCCPAHLCCLRSHLIIFPKVFKTATFCLHPIKIY